MCSSWDVTVLWFISKPQNCNHHLEYLLLNMFSRIMIMCFIINPNLKIFVLMNYRIRISHLELLLLFGLNITAAKPFNHKISVWILYSFFYVKMVIHHRKHSKTLLNLQNYWIRTFIFIQTICIFLQKQFWKCIWYN